MNRLVNAVFLIFITVFVSAQSNTIAGSWLLIKAEFGNEVQEPYSITDFRGNGIMSVMDFPVGTWKYDTDGNTIIMTSSVDKDFNGAGSILKLTKDELILSKDRVTYSYIKIDKKALEEDNKKSGLSGIWEIKNGEDDGSIRWVKFEYPDSFLFLEASDNEKSAISGTWIYNPIEKAVVITGFIPLLKGKNIISSLSTDAFVLENDGTRTAAKKINPVPVEHLTFEFEDFEDEDTGEYLYDDENELPWHDFGEMVSTLKGINSIQYDQGRLLEELNVFRYSTWISEISVNEEEPNVTFSNALISHGETIVSSENRKGGLTEMYNVFFPRDEPSLYRISGTETIIVPGGTFECTVVEGFDGEDKIKYWMINDLPGIYAKSIREQTDVFGDLEYLSSELETVEYSE